MLFWSCKGWNKEREYHRRSSEFNRPRWVCVCKTNKLLQNRPSYSETDHRVLTKRHLCQNYAWYCKDVIFHTRKAGRQAADTTNIHPESKASGVNAACVPICCWIQAFFPPPFTLFVSPNSFIQEGVASFPTPTCATGDRFTPVPLRRWMAGLSLWWQVDCRW